MSKKVNVLEVAVPLKMFGKAIEAVAGLPGSPHGPTVLTRWALRGISTFIRDRNGHYNCADCGERSHDAYMVNKDVWHDVLHESEIGKQGMFLHLKCLDARVQRTYGRRLMVEDFQDLPINEGIFFGFKLGSVK